MCFTKRPIDKLVTVEEDLVVYKTGSFLPSGFAPSFRSVFRYKLNKLTPIINLRHIDADQSGSISEGYHAYKHYDTAYYNGRFRYPIGKFIVPAGSKMYQNDTVIVASQIKWVGLIATKDMKFWDKVKMKFRMLYQ